METVALAFEPGEKGGFSAYVAEIPGANSQRETLEVAREMALETLYELFNYRRGGARTKVSAVFKQLVLARLPIDRRIRYAK